MFSHKHIIQCLLFFIIELSFFLAIFIQHPQILAATTTLQASPQTGSFDKAFDVNLIIDGHGEVFNAAQAKVNASPNLYIEGITLGDCNFSFLTTPNRINPSFKGVILGGSSSKCTVYTLTMAAKAKGDATITIADAKVIGYKNPVNLSTKIYNGTYTLSSITTKGVLGEKTVNSKKELYGIILTVLSSDNKTIKNINVTLNTAQGKLPIDKKTDNHGKVTFLNLQPGIYTVTIKEQKTILNLKGKDHIIELSIKLKPEGFFDKLMSKPFNLITTCIALLITISIILIWKKRLKNKIV
jgi:hypothetical protein